MNQFKPIWGEELLSLDDRPGPIGWFIHVHYNVRYFEEQSARIRVAVGGFDWSICDTYERKTGCLFSYNVYYNNLLTLYVENLQPFGFESY